MTFLKSLDLRAKNVQIAIVKIAIGRKIKDKIVIIVLLSIVKCINRKVIYTPKTLDIAAKYESTNGAVEE